MNRSTIAAICTPRGYGGVGIVKLSGPDSLRIARRIFRSKGGRLDRQKTHAEHESSFRANQLRYGVVVQPEDGSRIDEVLVATMRAPKTYTGEDVIEINAHAGPVVLHTILETVLKQGARLAEPGEFTRRAFLNGRIDLTQAEAVVDLINAKTTASAGMANAQMAGHLRVEIERISENVKRLIALNEARIDFPEDMEKGRTDTVEYNDIEMGVLDPLRKILERFHEGRIFRDGLKLAVVGRPNVGKSSLMNALAKSDRAIVTDIPGTTRDAVEDFINIRGVPVVIVDTAGLQKTENPVEIIGIEKTFRNIEIADLILFVVEEGRGIQPEDRKIFTKIKDKSLIIVINKRDLEKPKKRTAIPKEWAAQRYQRVSALHGAGLDLLEAAIYDFVSGDDQAQHANDFAPNLRHKALLEKSLDAARAARDCVKHDEPGELAALDLNECLAGLDEILGRHLKADILGRIFSQFCIGK
ncbi:MAG: tRNA uridine-5-carboxymethylaminomethyl(34) synthesis GTPase MnmE [Desulfobacterales bacterium]|nr:tRNA uridine-5-carboxymethylaminomethyl(34) synthesis GTPase MnmE [Desulfobacterales bacterium]